MVIATTREPDIGIYNLAKMLTLILPGSHDGELMLSYPMPPCAGERRGLMLYRHVITCTNGSDCGNSQAHFGKSNGEGETER